MKKLREPETRLGCTFKTGYPTNQAKNTILNTLKTRVTKTARKDSASIEHGAVSDELPSLRVAFAAFIIT